LENEAVLFRWSKLIDPNDEIEWETRLLLDEVAFSIEKLVNRKRSRISSFCETRELADSYKTQYGGGVARILPEEWEPAIDPSEARILRIRDQFIVSETDDEATLADLGEQNPGREILSFPPQLAFGTGGHPTTANCLRFLVDAAAPLADKPWQFLDLGCGSGILSVAAAKLGAEQTVAVEFDPRALNFARLNGERHNTKNQIEYLEADVRELLKSPPKRPYEIIAANLFSDLLVEVIPMLEQWLHPEGHLIISGFLTSQAKTVNEVAEKHGIPLENFLRRGKWVAAMS